MFEGQKKALSLQFDAGQVKSLIEELVPKEFTASRAEAVRYKIDSRWKKGILTKLIVDEVDITHTITRNQVQDKIETILKMTKDYKPYYTGMIKFDVEKAGGQIELIYVLKGHFAISKDFRKKD